MSFNPVIKGYNALWKLIGKGFSGGASVGIRVRFCRVYAQVHIPQSLKSKTYLDQRVGAS